MRVLSGLFVLGLTFVGVSLVASPASADGPVIEIEGIECFVGRPQRPNSFYVLQRVHGRAEVIDLRTSFTDEIVRDADGVDR